MNSADREQKQKELDELDAAQRDANVKEYDKRTEEEKAQDAIEDEKE